MLLDDIRLVEEDIRAREEKLELLKISFVELTQDAESELASRRKQLEYLKSLRSKYGDGI